MHISFFIGQLNSGGAEKVISMLANHYIAKGWSVDIVMLLGNRVDKEHFCINDGIRIFDLSQKGKSSYLKGIFQWIRGIRRYVKNNRPNIIVSFIGRINALVLTSTLGLNIPIIISERNDPKNDRRGRIMYEYCKWIYKFASIIVYQTSYQRNCFPRSYYDKSIIIPNPLVISELPAIEEDNLIVTAGRLNEQKNHFLLIEAISIVKESFPVVKCKIYGEGDLRKELQDRIDKEGLSYNISLEGQKNNVLEYVGRGKIFVMTSDREGLSNALMEAMMLGKVCVSTDYPGVEDIIEDGVSGYIVPRRNANALAEKLLNVLTNKDCNVDLIRKNARNKMLNNSSEKVLEKWDDIINNLLNI